jgi:hypothetical protein
VFEDGEARMDYASDMSTIYDLFRKNTNIIEGDMKREPVYLGQKLTTEGKPLVFSDLVLDTETVRGRSLTKRNSCFQKYNNIKLIKKCLANKG